MPKIAKELSPLAVSRLPTGRHPVGGVPGLCILVEPNRSRRWLLRVMISGKRQDLGLGGYPGVTLSQARQAARELRLEVMQGKDPANDRRCAKKALKEAKANSRTFKECAESLIDSHKHGWDNDKHIAQWSSTLSKYVYPAFGNKSVQDVTSSDVLRVLQPIWFTRTETASRLRGRIEKVFSMAIAQGFRSAENPARWKDLLEHSLPPVAKTRKIIHHPAMPFNEMPAFLNLLRQREGIAAKALEFTILTAARSGETRGACWSEIDLEKSIWVIPARRMKARREHRVPLSPRAVSILKKLPKTGELIFPASRSGKMLSDMTLTAVLRRMQIDEFTVHGFRSTFRDWAAEKTSYPREVCEAALAHVNPNTSEAPYLRSDLFEKRKALMTLWDKSINKNTKCKGIQMKRKGTHG